MTRFVHLLNCGLWSINAITWAAWSHHVGMATISLAAAALAGFMWWSEQI